VSFLDPHKQSVIRAAQHVLAHRSAVASGPVVLWQAPGEHLSAFEARCTATRAQLPTTTLLLAVEAGRRRAPALPGIRHVQLPPKLHTLLHPTTPSRYRICTGGRGSAKSWSFATVLVLRALTSPVRVLCVREIQLSIRQSVHRLLTDRIDALGLAPHFDIKEHSITSRAGGEFIFEGLYSNFSKLKSLEGVSLCWIEESESVSERSLETLIPTIRATGSELWLTMNPDDEHAAAYRRFVINPPPGCRHVHVTLDDNPWLPVELRREADYLRSVDYDAFAHIWLGATRRISNAIVFANKYVVEEFTPGADWDGPYQGSDLGFAVDPTTLVRVWVKGQRLYIEFECYAIGVDIIDLPALFDQIPRAREYVTRMDSARPETISHLQQHGYPNVRAVTKGAGSVESGIAHIRSYECVVIHPRCTHTLDEFQNYAYRVDRLSGDVLPDLKPGSDHLIDALRYALQPLVANTGALGFLAWLAQESAADATRAGALADRPGVVVRELTQEGHH